MLEPKVRHFYVKIHKSYVHLVQYGHHESLIRSTPTPSPSSSFNSSGRDDSRLSLSTSVSGLADGSRSSNLTNPSLHSGTCNVNKLVIFVPGNPGVLGIYHDYLVALYKTLGKPSDRSNNPVILAISHNNFDHPDHCDYQADERICIDESELSFVERTKLDSYPNAHEIELQIMYKLFILKRLLKLDLNQTGANDCKLVFVGHSIGSYVILRLLQDQTLAKLHAGSVLIHPVLENLAITEKGTVIKRYFNLKLDYLLQFLIYVTSRILSNSVRLGLVKWMFKPDFVERSSNMVLESVGQLACFKTLTALIEMAKSEFVYVKDLDHETMIKPHVNRLKLIYTIGDHWVNGANRQQLSELYPELHIEEQETQHAFIMDPVAVSNYAIKVGMFIQEMLD